jgi:hypothetical protein
MFSRAYTTPFPGACTVRQFVFLFSFFGGVGD